MTCRFVPSETCIGGCDYAGCQRWCLTDAEPVAAPFETARHTEPQVFLFSQEISPESRQ